MSKIIIVGAGPCGLALAFLLSQQGKDITLIDANSMVGGCHRITYSSQNLHTEHAVKIYSDSYVNFRSLLKAMNMDFYKIFRPYKFTLSDISGQSIEHFNISEIMKLTRDFLIFMYNSEFGLNTSVEEYCKTNNFSPDASDYLDRLCRLTDGADSTRYTVNKLFQLFNQQSLYKIYQPSVPFDIELFPKWIAACKNTEILLNTTVREIANSTTIITNIGKTLKADKIIFAIPPMALLNIKNSTKYFGDFTLFANQTLYSDDIPIIFHWDTYLTLPPVYGFPKTEWGLAFIVLTDYESFSNKNSKTVINTVITKTNTKSSITGLTANETLQVDDLLMEAFRQLKISFPNLPTPTASLLSPLTFYNQGKWSNLDKPYVAVANQIAGPDIQSLIAPNLYNIGTHSKKSKYAFTSVESAVTNAVYLANSFNSNCEISEPLTITYLLWIMILIFAIVFASFVSSSFPSPISSPISSPFSSPFSSPISSPFLY